MLRAIAQRYRRIQQVFFTSGSSKPYPMTSTSDDMEFNGEIAGRELHPTNSSM